MAKALFCWSLKQLGRPAKELDLHSLRRLLLLTALRLLYSSPPPAFLSRPSRLPCCLVVIPVVVIRAAMPSQQIRASVNPGPTAARHAADHPLAAKNRRRCWVVTWSNPNRVERRSEWASAAVGRRSVVEALGWNAPAGLFVYEASRHQPHSAARSAARPIPFSAPMRFRSTAAPADRRRCARSARPEPTGARPRQRRLACPNREHNASLRGFGLANQACCAGASGLPGHLPLASAALPAR